MSDDRPETLTILIEEEDGMLIGQVKELPGCFISGRDMAELTEAANEAIALYLQEDRVEAESKVVPLRRKSKSDKRARNAQRHLIPSELELVYEA